MTRWIRNLSPRAELVLVGLLCFGSAFVISTISAVRGRVPALTNARTAGQIGFELVVGGAAAVILALRGWQWRHFRVRVNGENFFAGTLVAVVYLGFASLVTVVAFRFAPMLRPSPAQHVRHTAVLALTLLYFVVNSLFEEMLVNAYVVQALDRLDVRHPILWSAAIRASYHSYQGVLAPFVIFVFGAALAAIFIRRRDLGVPVVAHTLVNMTWLLLFMQ